MLHINRKRRDHMTIKNTKSAALAIGSTSAIALIAATSQAFAQDGLYMGFSVGGASGLNPAPADSSSPNDYEMGGAAISGFIGVQKDMGGDMFGGVELAYTGPTEGDENDESSYEYAYDTNYTIDAKARLGRHFGSVDVYGFGGVSVGSINGPYYGNDYRFYGVNAGAGAQMNITENMFAGVEYIHRFTIGETDSEPKRDSGHSTLALRVGYKF